MAFQSLASLQRRRRQLETLRTMLSGVNQLLELVSKIESERELTADEQNEAHALYVRKDRLEKSLYEAGG